MLRIHKEFNLGKWHVVSVTLFGFLVIYRARLA